MAFAPIFGTGWETGHLGTEVLTYGASDWGVYQVASGGVGGSYCLRLYLSFDLGTGGAHCSYAISPSVSEVYTNVWVKPDPSGTGDPGGQVLVFIDDGNYIYVDSDRDGTSNTYYWHAWVNTTQVATGTVGASDAWTNLQLRVVISNTGTIQTRINGVSDIDYSGDTMPGASNLINEAWLWGGKSPDLLGYYFDNWVIGTGGWPSDICFSAALVPDADTAQKDYTASTGSDNYAMVDEIPPSDTDYVWEDTATGTDLYSIANWDGMDKQPLLVAQWARMWKTAAATHQQKLKLKSGTTTSEQTFDMSTSPQYYYRIFDDDPNTSSEWAHAAIDALQVGQEATVVPTQVRLGQHAVEVGWSSAPVRLAGCLWRSIS